MKEESGAPPTLNRSFSLRVIIFFVHGVMAGIGVVGVVGFVMLASVPTPLPSFKFIHWVVHFMVLWF